MLNLMTIAKKLFEPESKTECLTKLRSSAISEHSSLTGMPKHIRAWLMLSAGVSPANHFRSPEKEPEPMIPGICGPQPLKSFASLDPNTHSWKMSQDSYRGATGTLKKFLKTWPRAGMMQNGKLYQREKWARRINETDCGSTVPDEETFHHTPNTTGLDGGSNSRKALKNRQCRLHPTPTSSMVTMADFIQAKFHSCKRPTYQDAKRMYPTPTKQDAENNGGPSQFRWNSLPLNAVIGGQLNPTWVELLMGWPKGWTSLDPISVLEYKEWVRGFSDEEENNKAQKMPTLQTNNESQKIRPTLGGLRGLVKEEVLQSPLRQSQKNIDKTRLQLEGEKTPEGGLRSVREEGLSSGAPHKPGHQVQRSGGHPNTMQALPQLLARYGKEAWADGSWEDGVPRVDTGIKHRLNRLKALGNGQVPAVAKVAWGLLNE